MLVEDDIGHAELIKRNLQDHLVANKIHHVLDGESALDYLHRRGDFTDPKTCPRPHVILLDLRLPKVDGLEVLKVPKISRSVSEKQEFRGQNRILRPNGEVRWVSVRSSPIHMSEGRVLGRVGTMVDITERKNAEETITRQLKKLETLLEIDVAITSNTDLDDTLKVLLEQITSRLEVDAADILLYEAPTQTLLYAHGRGFHARDFANITLRIGRSCAGLVVLERRKIHIPDINKEGHEAGYIPSIWKEEGFVTYLGVLLISKGEINGVLEPYRRSMLKPDDDLFGFLDALADQAAIAIDNATLFRDLQQSNLELTLAYDTTLEGWAKALELRDAETEGHSRRVTEMTMRLARALDVPVEELTHVRRGALLHDIGKMGIPDSILHKTGMLSTEEWAIMHQHPIFAFELLSTISFLRTAVDIPYCHHEKWDCSGYPRGLRSEQIPISARIFAVVDVWDALLSDRPYRVAWSEEDTLKYMQANSGKHFDPRIVEVFLGLLDV